jgi:hypothetical protein
MPNNPDRSGRQPSSPNQQFRTYDISKASREIGVTAVAIASFENLVDYFQFDSFDPEVVSRIADYTGNSEVQRLVTEDFARTHLLSLVLEQPEKDPVTTN